MRKELLHFTEMPIPSCRSHDHSYIMLSIESYMFERDTRDTKVYHHIMITPKEILECGMFLWIYDQRELMSSRNECLLYHMSHTAIADERDFHNTMVHI